MKHIFLNLKRFDISPEKGGVNRLAPMKDWGRTIVSGTQDALTAYDPAEVEFVMYMPEAHLLGAAAAKTENSPVQLGCQGVYRADTAVGGNFGAFTTNRPANAAAQMGCASTLIGHCEERNDKMGILAEAGVTGQAAAQAFTLAAAWQYAASHFDERYAVLTGGGEKNAEIELFLLCAAKDILDRSKKAKGTVYFSATLAPFDAAGQMLGRTATPA